MHIPSSKLFGKHNECISMPQFTLMSGSVLSLRLIQHLHYRMSIVPSCRQSSRTDA